MDISNMLIDAMIKQREFIKSRFDDHQIHCETCSMTIHDDEPYFLLKKGWFHFKVICENCKQLGRN